MFNSEVFSEFLFCWFKLVCQPHTFRMHAITNLFMVITFWFLLCRISVFSTPELKLHPALVYFFNVRGNFRAKQKVCFRNCSIKLHEVFIAGFCISKYYAEYLSDFLIHFQSAVVKIKIKLLLIYSELSPKSRYWCEDPTSRRSSELSSNCILKQ